MAGHGPRQISIQSVHVAAEGSALERRHTQGNAAGGRRGAACQAKNAEGRSRLPQASSGLHLRAPAAGRLDRGDASGSAPRHQGIHLVRPLVAAVQQPSACKAHSEWGGGHTRTPRTSRRRIRAAACSSRTRESRARSCRLPRRRLQPQAATPTQQAHAQQQCTRHLQPPVPARALTCSRPRRRRRPWPPGSRRGCHCRPAARGPGTQPAGERRHSWRGVGRAA